MRIMRGAYRVSWTEDMVWRKGRGADTVLARRTPRAARKSFHDVGAGESFKHGAYQTALRGILR